jgi:hypothetical protein
VASGRIGADQEIHLAGCVALQAAHDLAPFLALGGALFGVNAGALILSHPCHHEAVQRSMAWAG